MRCSNCGKDVPFLGNVCPWCHADKKKDRLITVAATSGAVIGGIAGVLVVGWWGALAGGLIGAVGGAVAVSRKTPRKA